MEDILDKGKWTTALNQSMINILSKTNHLLTSYANEYVKVVDTECPDAVFHWTIRFYFTELLTTDCIKNAVPLRQAIHTDSQKCKFQRGIHYITNVNYGAANFLCEVKG